MRSPLQTNTNKNKKFLTKSPPLPPPRVRHDDDKSSINKQPLSAVELRYLDYLKRELRVDLRGCTIGYFRNRNGTVFGGGNESTTSQSSRYYRGCVATEDIKEGAIIVRTGRFGFIGGKFVRVRVGGRGVEFKGLSEGC